MVSYMQIGIHCNGVLQIILLRIASSAYTLHKTTTPPAVATYCDTTSPLKFLFRFGNLII